MVDIQFFRFISVCFLNGMMQIHTTRKNKHLIFKDRKEIEFQTTCLPCVIFKTQTTIMRIIPKQAIRYLPKQYKAKASYQSLIISQLNAASESNRDKSCPCYKKGENQIIVKNIEKYQKRNREWMLYRYQCINRDHQDKPN